MHRITAGLAIAAGLTAIPLAGTAVADETDPNWPGHCPSTTDFETTQLGWVGRWPGDGTTSITATVPEIYFIYRVCVDTASGAHFYDVEPGHTTVVEWEGEVVDDYSLWKSTEAPVVEEPTPTPTVPPAPPVSMPVLPPPPQPEHPVLIPPVVVETNVPDGECHEDMECWDCETMGNLICGPRKTLPVTGAGFVVTIIAGLALLAGGLIVTWRSRRRLNIRRRLADALAPYDRAFAGITRDGL